MSNLAQRRSEDQTHAASHSGDGVSSGDLDGRPKCRQARLLNTSQLDPPTAEADPEPAVVAPDGLEIHRQDLLALAKARARDDRSLGEIPPLDGPVLRPRQDVLAPADDGAARRGPGVRGERPDGNRIRRAQRRMHVEHAAERGREDDLPGGRANACQPRLLLCSFRRRQAHLARGKEPGLRDVADATLQDEHLLARVLQVMNDEPAVVAAKDDDRPSRRDVKGIQPGWKLYEAERPSDRSCAASRPQVGRTLGKLAGVTRRRGRRTRVGGMASAGTDILKSSRSYRQRRGAFNDLASLGLAMVGTRGQERTSSLPVARVLMTTPSAPLATRLPSSSRVQTTCHTARADSQRPSASLGTA